MKILILAPYPPTVAPSQRFRFEQYLDAIQMKGWKYHYAPFINLKTWQILHKPGKFVQKAIGILSAFWRRFLLLFTLKQYNYIFIHREASHIGPPVFEWLIAKVFRKKIIYDFDDAVWLPNYSHHNRYVHRLKYYRKIFSVLKWSYKVSAGNAYLAHFAQQKNENIVIIPTTIDTENYHNKVKDQTTNPIVIGWTGTLTTIRYLIPLLPILGELEKEYDFTFRVIANENPNFILKSFEFVPWKKESEIVDLLQFSIGVMPLEDDRWAKGKCGFKALQYMALGIPAVISPVGVNTQIVDDGQNGFLCNTPAEWEEALSSLIENEAQRKAMGIAARKKIIEQYSVSANTNHFLSLFE